MMPLLAEVAGGMVLLGGIVFGLGAGWLLGRKLGLTGVKLALVALIGVGPGLLFGLFGGIIHYSALKKQQADARRGWNLVPVVVAAVDIAPGETLTFDMISQRSIPEQFATQDMVKPDSASHLVNEKVAVPLAQGDIFLWGASCPTTPEPARTP